MLDSNAVLDPQVKGTPEPITLRVIRERGIYIVPGNRNLDL